MAQATGLGKGLSALLGEQKNVGETSATPTQSDNDTAGQLELSLKDIIPWSKQPRQHFDKEELSELAASISENGIIQPIVVRKNADKYEIIAGERRWRATQLSGIKTIPAVIMEADDKKALEIALVENIQRKDLKPLEMAHSYQELLEEYKYTQEKLGEVLGKSRSQVTNTLRLLTLSDGVQKLLNDEKISAGHARTLVSSKHADQIAEKIVKQALSVRQTEQMVKKFDEFGVPDSNVVKSTKDPEIIELEKDLSKTLGFDVKVDDKGGKGKLTINYKSLKDLETILHLLKNKDSLAA